MHGPPQRLIVLLLGFTVLGITESLKNKLMRPLVVRCLKNNTNNRRLIQESIDTIFEYNPDRNAETFEKYRQLTLETCRKHADLELVVWPESMLSANSPIFLRRENNPAPISRCRLVARPAI